MTLMFYVQTKKTFENHYLGPWEHYPRASHMVSRSNDFECRYTRKLKIKGNIFLGPLPYMLYHAIYYFKSITSIIMFSSHSLVIYPNPHWIKYYYITHTKIVHRLSYLTFRIVQHLESLLCTRLWELNRWEAAYHSTVVQFRTILSSGMTSQ